ncbi:unnamed protein product [Menidia menidia]|uniref:Very-long-chain (3R)-3-hydroxyacyl-CoA dehydratase n=1 Tax=Menidia menidia TaxID=238744 RepID=A0A8S4AM57_9TELE|nr:unnamed protein product [Menidia menidia]
MTGFQVLSRVFLTWAVTHSVREVQSEDSVLLFVTAWTVTEIIRYSFYTFSLLNHLPFLIKWARYTFFIVLYPMGVSGELLTIYAALPHVQKTGLFSISLPNKYNFSFDYHAFLILVMVSYTPRIVPSSVVLTGFQVLSRVFLTWAVTHSVREVQSEDSVLLFVTAWTVTEIIRYSFYTFSLLNHLPFLIKWARYTFFIVLYPMGVSGELLTIYAALPHVQKTGLFSISLPNKYNFSFDYHAFLILVMVSYIPLFPQLYFHMIRQRKKVLGPIEDYSKVE